MRKLGGIVGSVCLAALMLVPTSANADPIDLAAANVKLKVYATGLDNPVAVAFRGNDSKRMYVAQQSGSIVTVVNGHVSKPILTFNVSHGGEEGLLG